MDKPTEKKLLGLTIKEIDMILQIREVKLIGGPMDGKIILISNKNINKYIVGSMSNKKCVFGFPDERKFDRYEYHIRKTETGEWVGE